MKYHISPTTGNPNQCRAKAGACPFGTDEQHYATKPEARAAFEAGRGSSFNAMGDYGFACPNSECNERVHDLRQPGLIKRCIETAAAGDRGRERELLASLKDANSACMSNAYLRDVGKLQTTLKLALFNTPDPRQREGIRQSLVTLVDYKASDEPSPLPTADTPAQLDQAIFSLGLQRREQLRAQRDSTPPQAPPVPPPNAAVQVSTASGLHEELDSMSLDNIYAMMKSEEGKAQINVVEREVEPQSRFKRMLGIDETERIEQVKHTARHDAIKNYVSELPKKSKEIFFLYEAVVNEPNNSKALKRIGEEFSKMRAAETRLAREQENVDLNNSVESMLRNITSPDSLR